MKQGDVYWYRFRAPDKRRPVLILTRNSAIPYPTGITVAPITTTIRVIPPEVALTPQQNGVFRRMRRRIAARIKCLLARTHPKEVVRQRAEGKQ